VRLALQQDDLSSYEQAADFLNFANFDLVCLQHEYGIFGGPAGRSIPNTVKSIGRLLPFAGEFELTIMIEVVDRRDAWVELSFQT
jgi:hypothetical protein